MLINAGITTVVYAEGYADDLAREMIAETGITISHFSPEKIERSE
jgi:dCMP deaminase